jgi:hypothetical protein
VKSAVKAKRLSATKESQTHQNQPDLLIEATMTKADDNENIPSSDDTIEKAFALLQSGKKCQLEGQNWNAADKFVQARRILQSLAKDSPRGTEEEQNIAELYDQKAREYLNQSRQCLIEAMKQEKDKDEKEEGAPPLYTTSSLTDDQAEARIRTFYSLFSRKMGNKKDENITDQQWSIEERLQELNASLPSGFKTSDERMDSLNRGLNRLGLSLYTQKEPFARFKDEVPKDDDEQVAEIMAQARDEVSFEKQFGAKTPSDTRHDEGDEEDDDSDEEEEDEEDAFLDDEQLAIKKIRRKVVKAQVKLAELVALLDEAKAQKQAEDEEKDIEDDNDDDSEDSVEKPDSATYLASGKKKLKSVQRDLKKALTEWIESLL